MVIKVMNGTCNIAIIMLQENSTIAQVDDCILRETRNRRGCCSLPIRGQEIRGSILSSVDVLICLHCTVKCAWDDVRCLLVFMQDILSGLNRHQMM